MRKKLTPQISKYLPILDWGSRYNSDTFMNDMVAAVIVTIMLIPQSLAYALLAGLPPEIGLYASILPLVLYAIFGTSRTLAVGPVAVLSLMTAAAAGKVAVQGSETYIAAAMILALLSGVFLLALGILRLGFLANFLSHPVVSGFITASGLLIASSQLKHILGVEAHGHSLVEILGSIYAHIGQINWPTFAIGASSLLFLFWVRKGLKPLLMKFGVKEKAAAMISRGGPVIAVVAGILSVSILGLDKQGVSIVGDIPTGLPKIGLPPFDRELWMELVGSAVLISVIGFVESVSVAQTLAAKRRQRIDPDQELIGLGTASIASGVSSGFPVTGGFARSAVNFDAGAETPAAGAFTAVGIAFAALFLTPFLYFLPKAVLAATIIVAVLTLIDLKILKHTWKFSKADFAAVLATILVTLTAGVELGVSTGVALSIFLHLYATSRPHFAIVGQVPGTQHFRNVNRHAVVVPPKIITIRVDESLYFANARFLEDTVYDVLAARDDLEHLVLMCTAVNWIDSSGLESLEAINHRLKDAGIQLHLCEVKGPVMDHLERTEFIEDLTGQIFMHQFQAMETLAPETTAAALYGDAEVTDPTAFPCPSYQLAGLRRIGKGHQPPA